MRRATTAESQSQRDPPRVPLQPLRALRALRRLERDPNSTAEVFTIIESLSGAAPQRVMARFRSDPGGRRLLAERPEVLATLRQRARLESLPASSLGRAYLTFLDSEGITADGLVQASMEGRRRFFDPESEFAYVTNRIRDTHDLWHTVTGYRGDIVGEAALLGFNVAQLHNPGVAVIVLAAMLRLRSAAATRLIGRAFQDGLRAAWLPSVHWEELLPLPVREVRALLRIEHAPAYAPLR